MTLKRSSADLGKRLTKYRKLAGLSAQQLSDRVNGEISRSVIANIESGRKTDVTVDQLLALSWALDIPPVALALPLDQPYEEVLIVDGPSPVTLPSHEAALVFGMSGIVAEVIARDAKSDLAGFQVARNDMVFGNMLAAARFDAYQVAEYAKTDPEDFDEEDVKDAARALAEKHKQMASMRKTVRTDMPWIRASVSANGND